MKTDTITAIDKLEKFVNANQQFKDTGIKAYYDTLPKDYVPSYILRHFSPQFIRGENKEIISDGTTSKLLIDDARKLIKSSLEVHAPTRTHPQV